MIKRIFFTLLLVSLSLFSIHVDLVFANDDIYRVSNFVPRNGLPLYVEPRRSSKLIATIPRSTSWIKIQGRPQAGWQKISWNSQQGWIQAGTIELDRAATNITGGKVDCLHDPKIKNKACCGIVETTDDPSELVKIYSVTGVPKNQLLQMNTAPGKRENIASLMPHNATWIMKLNKRKLINGVRWEKVKWGGKIGWVDSRKIQYSPELTSVNDMKRKSCNVPKDCAPDLSALLKDEIQKNK